MRYARVQFVKAIVIDTKPWKTLLDASDPDYFLEDDGPGHILVGTPGALAARVPWTNIAVAVPLPVAVPTVLEHKATRMPEIVVPLDETDLAPVAPDRANNEASVTKLAFVATTHNKKSRR